MKESDERKRGKTEFSHSEEEELEVAERELIEMDN
jgi:hypothetical protein